MELCLFSPPEEDPRETAVLSSLVADGLPRAFVRYHVRKPGWSRDALARYLRALPAALLPRVVLHEHHELALELGLGGRHFKDDKPIDAPPPAPGVTSRACHEPDALLAAAGLYDVLIASPLFPSLSKPGYAPRHADWQLARVRARLESPGARRSRIFALGGIDASRVAECARLGFDGVAVLGAVWLAEDPALSLRRLCALVSAAP